MRVSRPPIVPTALALLLLPGCADPGPRPMRVWGAVSYDGQPVEDGRIIFSPTGNTPGGSTGGAIEAGRYDIPSRSGPYAGGTYRVEISSLEETGRTLENAVDPGGPALAVFFDRIPPAYNSQSTLSITVADDSSGNQHDFDLEEVATQ
ncbi:hypothetical protein [Tautonia plasticadhaerens]|uniref:Carboxypeptidase regulatory-like domain-containing protein n=1 Tax=Tautonia plasticadhaerens TaxID=2527974 RepID=A0A518GV37_9BACT|nr:hypothetical protein [Tautonia plasticadhaerens]QDV32450.1 hypothetical protein ElP_02820 [Tautonia plasticadhaerens]